MQAELLPRSNRHCGGCPLNGGGKQQHVPTEIVRMGERPEQVDVMFVGQNPGREETARMYPFVGPSSAIVRDDIGRFATDSYAVTHVVRCRPVGPDGSDRPAEAKERNHCIKYLLEEIDQFRPKKVVALGGVAAGGFTTFSSIAGIRGQEIETTTPGGHQFLLCPTFHPAAVIHDGGHMREPLRVDVENALTDRRHKEGWDIEGKYKVLHTVEQVESLVNKMLSLSADDIVAVDVETHDGVQRIQNSLITIGFAWNGKTGYSLPLNHPESPFSHPDEINRVKAALRRLFTEKPGFSFWLGHNSKFELQQIHTYLGIWVENAPFLDTMLIAHLLDENRKLLQKVSRSYQPFSLKQLVAEHFNVLYEDQEIMEARSSGRLRFVAWEKVAEYNAKDAVLTRRLYDKLKQDAGKYWAKAFRISSRLHSAALLLFAITEINGFKVDIDTIIKLQGPESEMQAALKSIDVQLRENTYVRAVNRKLVDTRSGGLQPLFGDPWAFSADKPDHLSKLFFEELKLAPVSTSEKTDRPSLDSEFWETYKDQHPLVQLVNDRNEIKKLTTSYLNQIREFIDKSPDCIDGRVRSSFHMMQVITGRTSSVRPNVQAIPRGESPYQKAIKNVFIVDPGNALIATDVAQGEIFWMAQTTGDREFAKMLWHMKNLRDQQWLNPTIELAERVRNECDVHRQSAAMIYGVPVDQVTREQRSRAKSIVSFGLIYGQSPKTLAKMLDMEEKQTIEIKRKLFAKFPASEQGLKRLEEHARKYGYVESVIGRRRRLPTASSKNHGEQARAERQAKNSPIQSILSDYTLFQAGRLQRYILKRKLPWKIVNCVHDAVLAEVPVGDAARYVTAIRRFMMDTETFAKAFNVEMFIPVLADVEMGASYGAMHPVDSWNKGENCLPVAMNKVAGFWKKAGFPVAKPDFSVFQTAAAA